MKRNITLKIESHQLALLCHLTPLVMREAWLGRPVPWYAEAGGIELSDAIPENSLRLTRTAFTWSVHFPRPTIRFQKLSLTFSQITLSSAELCQLTGAKIQKWKCYGFLSHHVLLQLFLVLFCIFGPSSPYETKQFLDASKIRNAHSVFFLCISHPSGS